MKRFLRWRRRARIAGRAAAVLAVAALALASCTTATHGTGAASVDPSDQSPNH